MAEETVVVAFGGNASYPPTIKGLAQEQLDLMAEACRHLLRIIDSGRRNASTSAIHPAMNARPPIGVSMPNPRGAPSAIA